MHLLHNKELTTTDDVLKHKTNEDELVTRLHSNTVDWIGKSKADLVSHQYHLIATFLFLVFMDVSECESARKKKKTKKKLQFKLGDAKD